MVESINTKNDYKSDVIRKESIRRMRAQRFGGKKMSKRKTFRKVGYFL